MGGWGWGEGFPFWWERDGNGILHRTNPERAGSRRLVKSDPTLCDSSHLMMGAVPLVKLVVSVLFSLDVAGLLFSPYVCNFVSRTLRIFTFILSAAVPAVLVFLSQICKCSFLSGSLPR